MDFLLKSRIIIISGHYGSGKTNIAVNLAEAVAKNGKRVCVVDLDIVNPYFRSADNVKELKEAGVRTIIPEFAGSNVEIPSLPKEYYSVFITDEYSIIDVGGDADGAIVLASDHEKYLKCGYAMYYVYNCYRPMTASPERAYALLKSIEQTSHLAFSAIINNSNIGEETTKETVEASFTKAQRLSELSGLPIAATTAINCYGIEGCTQILNKTKRLF